MFTDRDIETSNRELVEEALAVAKRVNTGLTHEDLSRLTGLSQSIIRAIRVVLSNEGKIRDTGRVRLTRSGRQAKIWEAV